MAWGPQREKGIEGSLGKRSEKKDVRPQHRKLAPSRTGPATAESETPVNKTPLCQAWGLGVASQVEDLVI